MKKYIFPVVFYRDDETQKYIATLDGIELFCDGKTIEEAYAAIEEMLSDFVKLSIKVSGQVKEASQDYLGSVERHPGNVVMLLFVKVKNIEGSAGDKKVLEAETIEGGLPERTWKIYQLENGSIEDIIIRARGFDNNSITWMKNVIERESAKEAKALGVYVAPAPKPAPVPAEKREEPVMPVADEVKPAPAIEPEPEPEAAVEPEPEVEEEETEPEVQEVAAEETVVPDTKKEDEEDDDEEPPKKDESYRGQGRGAVGGFIGDFSKLTGEDIPDIRKKED